jgi:ATP-dependent RNA helicase DDX21
MSGKADVETYVHRSGRTGRAGKSGICVTLWQPKTRYALEEIEKEIGNQFEWRGALQPLEILAGCGQAVADELINIDQSIFPYFQDAANTLITQMGPEKALCAALARISGFTEKPKQKSLLNAQEGMVTIQFHSGKTIPSNGYVYGALMKNFSYEVAQSPKGMRLSKDLTSAVFDIPEEHLEIFKKTIDETVGFQWLSICEELPQLKMLDDSKGFDSRSPSGGRGRGGFSPSRGGGINVIISNYYYLINIIIRRKRKR